jgi:hypothetical protein
MEDFSTSLVREKIVFAEEGAAPSPAIDEEDDIITAEDAPNVVRSNRMLLKLEGQGGSEKVVVRSQNMHSTLRLSGRILGDYFRHGPFLGRSRPFDWDEQWATMLSNYEREFNPYNWGAVYINGKPVFRTRTSAFVDIIEQCALLTIDNYDATMKIARGALKKVGKSLRVDNSSSVASILSDNGETMRCGIMHRALGRDTTFSFTAAGREMPNRIVQSMGIVAAFLEAINLRFVSRKLQEKLGEGSSGMRSTAEANQLRALTGRLVALDKGIDSFEELYIVKYRPEKPVFFGSDS